MSETNNTNTAEYWNKIWSVEGLSTWRTYPKSFDYIVRACEDMSFTDFFKQHKLSILDVGSGNGFLLQMLNESKMETDLHGVDISEVAVQALHDRGFGGTIQTLPPLEMGADSFDIVIATEFLEHFKEPMVVMDELIRVATEAVIISVPNNCLDHNELKEHYQKWDYTTIREFLAKFHKIKHIDFEEVLDEMDCQGTRIITPSIIAVCKLK